MLNRNDVAWRCTTMRLNPLTTQILLCMWLALLEPSRWELMLGCCAVILPTLLSSQASCPLQVKLDSRRLVFLWAEAIIAWRVPSHPPSSPPVSYRIATSNLHPLTPLLPQNYRTMNSQLLIGRPLIFPRHIEVVINTRKLKTHTVYVNEHDCTEGRNSIRPLN